jgi:thiamine-monophosphate kinase
LFWLGWLLVTINASDIAASGSEPIAFVAALDLPSDLEVQKFERLLEGIQKSCIANGLKYVGGNLRESDVVRAVGTAVGRSIVTPLKRKGAADGDLVVVIGNGGRFWADVYRHKSGIKIDKGSSPLFAPVSQSKHMHVLHSAGLTKCAMDTSDGLAPTLSELSLVNELGIEVDLALIRGASNYGDVPQRSERLWMGWGDWTIVTAVSLLNFDALKKHLRSSGSVGCCIGRFTSEFNDVMLVDGGRQLKMGRLESERFAEDSWFALGINEYQRRLSLFDLP